MNDPNIKDPALHDTAGSLAGSPTRPLDGDLEGARIQDVRQPDSDTLLLQTHRGKGRTAFWLISTGEETARITRVFSRPRRSMARAVFRQWLLTRLVGGRVIALRRPHPMILGLEVARGPERYFLVLEMNRNHSNLLLLDGEERLLISLRHPSLGGRKLGAGQPYVPPARWRRFPGTIPLEDRLPATDEKNARQLEARWESLEAAGSLEKRRRPALQRARRELKKRQRRLDNLSVQKEETAGAEEWRRWGELLQIHRGRWRPGLESLEVPDTFSGGQPLVRIPLLARSDLGGNIARCFRRYRKLRDSLPHFAKRMESTHREVEQWGNIVNALAAALDQATLQAVASSLPAGERELRLLLQGGPVPEAGAAAKKGVMRRISSEGYTILIGRSRLENEQVTFRLGRGRDWWFHVQGIPGSHVLVQNPLDGSLPGQTMREAAWLAGYYSQGRKMGRVEVDYTQRKYVRKIKGGETGEVTYSQNRSVLVALEDPGLKQVLQRVDAGI